MFSKKAIKIDEIFTVDLTVSVKLKVKILSNFVAFLENTNFTIDSKTIYFMPSTFFFTDFLYNPHDLGDCSHGQSQRYETSDALSLDSPNTVC